jgi:hypothetical protein
MVPFPRARLYQLMGETWSHEVNDVGACWLVDTRPCIRCLHCPEEE